MTRLLLTAVAGAALFATAAQALPPEFRESRDLTQKAKPNLSYTSESADGIKGEIYSKIPVGSGSSTIFVGVAKAFYVYSHCQDNDDYPRQVVINYAGQGMLQCHAESVNDSDDVHDVNMTMYFVNKDYRYLDISVGGDGTSAIVFLMH